MTLPTEQPIAPSHPPSPPSLPTQPSQTPAEFPQPSLDIRIADRISYRAPDGSWRTAKVLLTKPIGVIAIDDICGDAEERAIVRLGWSEVFPPF